MAKKNPTVLVLTALVTLGLFSLAGAIVWFGLRLQPPGQSAPLSTSSNPPKSSKPTSPEQFSPASSPQSLGQVALESDRNVDYSKLRDELQRKDWRAADQETYERLLDAAGSEAQAQGFTPQDEMDTLSCKDLTTVDRLWSAASNGKFGFTAQQTILRVLGDYRKMYDEVGWQKLSGEWLIEWTYNAQTHRLEYKPGKEPDFTNPLPGQLPTVERGYNFDVSLDAALKRCKF